MTTLDPDPAERREAAVLDQRIIPFIAEAAAAWKADRDALDALLLDVFAYQVRWNPAYARYARARGADPDHINRPEDIPPVPARAFGQMRMATFPPPATVRRFRSSGTSGGQRSVLELDTLALADSALLPPFVRHLLPDRRELAWIALLPDPDGAPESSLAYMVGSAARQLGARPRYFVTASGALDADAAIAALSTAAAAAEPVLIAATAIALLALVDALTAAGTRIPLAPGSRVMETGGFKGQRRQVERHELYAAIADRLGVPVHAIVAEYGMTELVSQFYDTTLHAALTALPAGQHPAANDPRAPRAKAAPPWVRTMILDPLTLAPVAAGEEGLLVHLDLAARSSTVSLLTEDRGRALGDGFELLGRMPGASARGCSLALDDFLRLDAIS